MSRRPAVTVLVCAYNRLALLKKALSSVYAQTVRDFEVVVADDGSTDGTSRWLRRRRLPRLRLCSLPRNLGPATARNLALAAARGTYVAFLDSDDVWRPGYLADQLVRLRRAGVVAAVSEFDHIDAAGRVRPEWKKPPPVEREFYARATGQRSMPPLSTVAVRRSALTAIGGFDERFRRFCDDADMFVRLGERYGPRAFVSSTAALVGYRRHEDQMTGLLSNPFDKPPLGATATRSRDDENMIFDMLLYCRKHGL